MTVVFTHEREEARLEPFAYQLQAVEAVKDWEYAALFHEQGLGKTKIALDLALRWFGSGAVDSAVIVTKKGLIANWKKEIALHTTLEAAVLGERKRSSVLYNRPYRLYLTHYEAVVGDRSRFELFLRTRRVGVILDESQRIKNPESGLARCFLSLREGFERRVIMSGTPVANRPYDLWSQIKFLDGGKSLGNDFKAFRRCYDLPEAIEEAGEEQQAKGVFSSYESSLAGLFERIRGFSVRETKASSGITLPDKEIRVVWAEMEVEQAKLYAKYRDELAAELLRDGRLILDDAEAVFKRLLRLVQVACDPALLDEGYEGEGGKRPVLRTLVEEGLEGGSKVIVWTSFVANAEALARFLAGFGTVRLHGKMAMGERERSVERFLDDDQKRVLVATPGVAKEGLTLTVANRAIFYDRGFSLDDYLQAQDRIHRISQTRKCDIVNILAKNSIDSWVDRLLLAKTRMAAIAQGDLPPNTALGEAHDQLQYAIKEVLQ